MTSRARAAEAVREPLLERLPLETGWEAIGVPPGTTDRTLAGLDAAMLPFTAPGTAATALVAAGDVAGGRARDLDGEDWWFRCRFDWSPAAGDTEHVLRLEGLATLADVWLNGEHVLSSDNMHVAHDVAVDGLLGERNELVIGVSALRSSERRPGRPRWRTRLVPDQGLRWARTCLFGRIPAFAPGPAPVGPWRPVTLLTRRGVAIDAQHVRSTVDGEDGIVTLQLTVRSLDGFVPRAATATVTRAGHRTTTELELHDDGSTTRVVGTVRIPRAELWWPHTHGEPALYDVHVTLTGDGRAVDLPCGAVGFRALEPVAGPALRLRVNGEDLFLRGASLLPDAAGLDPPADRLRAMLERARDAGMNIVRLPGFGTYGSDELYDLCDRLGILVWQDFAFASLDYPVDDAEFLASVEREASGFLRRAGGHPSLAVLCGNSEMEQQVTMLGLDPALARSPLFDDVLPALVRSEEVDAHYETSSPNGGAIPIRVDGGVAQYFGVGAYRRPLEDARRAEVGFAAECLAFANVPDDDVLDALAPHGAGRFPHHPAWKTGVPRDSGSGWDFDDVRDHYLARIFELDPLELRAVDPDRYLALSRVVTGEVMARVLGEWRRDASPCAGAILWTLNDVLPGAGWGILDSAGRPKAAYWFVRRALAPVALWLTDEGVNGAAIHAANDTAMPIAGDLVVALRTVGGALVEQGETGFELAPRTTACRSVEEILGRFVDAGDAYRFGPRQWDAIVAELRTGDELVARTVHLPTRPTGTWRDDLGLTACADRASDGSFDVEITTAQLAYAVQVDAPFFARTDDYFTVSDGHPHRITLTPTDDRASVASARLRPVNGVGAPIREGAR
jgi:beta-mannosidase